MFYNVVRFREPKIKNIKRKGAFSGKTFNGGKVGGGEGGDTCDFNEQLLTKYQTTVSF